MLPSRKYYLDSIFDNFMDGTQNFDVMKCDIYEQDGAYHIEVDIPGFQREEISVDCEDGYVTIQAEKKSSSSEQDETKNYIKRERFYGKTVRKFYVGDVDQEEIQAEFKDGMLQLIVPKQEKLPSKRSIEIK